MLSHSNICMIGNKKEMANMMYVKWKCRYREYVELLCLGYSWDMTFVVI